MWGFLVTHWCWSWYWVLLDISGRVWRCCNCTWYRNCLTGTLHHLFKILPVDLVTDSVHCEGDSILLDSHTEHVVRYGDVAFFQVQAPFKREVPQLFSHLSPFFNQCSETLARQYSTNCLPFSPNELRICFTLYTLANSITPQGSQVLFLWDTFQVQRSSLPAFLVLPHTAWWVFGSLSPEVQGGLWWSEADNRYSERDQQIEVVAVYLLCKVADSGKVLKDDWSAWAMLLRPEIGKNTEDDQTDVETSEQMFELSEEVSFRRLEVEIGDVDGSVDEQNVWKIRHYL